MRPILLLATVLLTGCVTAPEIVVTYEQDRFGIPYPVINDEPYPLTEAERDAIGQKFVDAYCPAQ